jgi:hypothetical protein
MRGSQKALAKKARNTAQISRQKVSSSVHFRRIFNTQNSDQQSGKQPRAEEMAKRRRARGGSPRIGPNQESANA